MLYQCWWTHRFRSRNFNPRIEHPPVPYNEVARRLNLATGSIGFIRGRCLKRLKKLLQEKGF